MDRQSFKAVVAKLPARDVSFATSLLSQWERRGTLSGPQMKWVDILADRVNNPQPQPAAPVVSVGDFSGVMKLFATAKQNLRFPKIRLQVGPQEITLSLAGERSKAPGTVQVTDGGTYGQNTWFGRVSPEGEWTKGRDATPEIEAFLKEFSQRPAEVARKYGRLTGCCCFCRKALTDERSTAAGFGPVCAKNFGLEPEWKAAQAVLEARA